LLAGAQDSECAFKGCFCLNHFENLLVDIFYLLAHSDTNRSLGSRPTNFRTKIETAIAQDISVLPGLFRKLFCFHSLLNVFDPSSQVTVLFKQHRDFILKLVFFMFFLLHIVFGPFANHLKMALDELAV